MFENSACSIFGLNTLTFIDIRLKRLSFIDHYPTDEEDEGLDNEEVNFNEMVLEDEARLAVRNKRGRRFERIEFSNRLCIPGDVQCTLYTVQGTSYILACAMCIF